MKFKRVFLFLSLFLIVCGSLPRGASASPPPDPGWPRVLKKNGSELTIYQPQIDSWNNYRDIVFRCAIAVKKAGAKERKYGVAEIEAQTETDHENRTVVVIPQKRELRFPNTTDTEANTLRTLVDEIHPPVSAMTISLDRVLAYMETEKQSQQKAVELNLDPPKIFHSSKPAILVIFLGEPQLQPVTKDDKELMFAVNTNWDVFYATSSQRYYLLNGDNWLTTTDVVNGKWVPATALPSGLSSLPADENWADVRQQLPGRRETNPPVVFVSTKPAELLLTQGAPKYTPVPGTKLMRMTNTDLPAFMHTGNKQYYLLVAGRWFRASVLEGPWSAASKDLPADFAMIPDNDPAAFVKASVPGTSEAQDAILLASVPRATEVDLTNPTPVEVDYNGEPKFVPIDSTTVQYASNTSEAVFWVDNSYYCCSQGIWYTSIAATGPWVYSTRVPAAIYTIPASHPLHNVTYVAVGNATPTTVVYTQTAGYSGEYVASTGVLMFGAGMMVGAMIANNNDYWYGPYRYPVPYSYGCGARYNYARGGYYRGAAAYGPYGGAGAYAAYHPRTGTYSRGAYAYGPAGSASARSAYNPYTGTRAHAGRVDTAYGSAGRAAAYNPRTGNAVRGGYRSNDYGTVGGVQTNRGTGAVAWDTKNSQGAVAKGRNGNVYAGKDGNVYKKNNNGDWSSNTGSGWERNNNPQTRSTMDTQSQARSRGDQMHRNSSSGSARQSGGYNRSSGGNHQSRSYSQPSGSSRQGGGHSRPSGGGRGGGGGGGGRGGGGRRR